ncbi:MAG TPA: hypothetical protein VGI19_03430 [Candidatus Cybelea sp.]
MHDDKFAMGDCSRSAFGDFANVSGLRQPFRQIVVDKIESTGELLFIERGEDLLNQLGFLLPTQSVYLLVRKKSADSDDDELSEARDAHDLLPVRHFIFAVA